MGHSVHNLLTPSVHNLMTLNVHEVLTLYTNYADYRYQLCRTGSPVRTELQRHESTVQRTDEARSRRQLRPRGASDPVMDG